MNIDLILTLAAALAAGVLFAFASWRDAQPADPLKPRLIPWRALIIVSALLVVLALVHAVNLLGVETGTQLRAP